MTAVLIAVTLLAVAASAVVFLACAEKSREIETVIRNTGRFVTVRLDEPVDDESWGDCPDCGAVIERLTDLFNDTNPKGDR